MVPDTIDDRRSKGPARKDYRIMYENGYKKLQDSLIDVIAEEQAKLGYMKEPIRLYYPLSSLHHFFKSEGDAEAMQESLGGFPEATKEIFGEVQVSHKGDRFCFFLSENATEYAVCICGRIYAMYIHLGRDYVLNDRDIIGIFNLETTTVSPRGREFLNYAQKNGAVVSLSDDLPQCYVLADAPVDTVYLSELSSAAMKRRTEMSF